MKKFVSMFAATAVAISAVAMPTMAGNVPSVRVNNTYLDLDEAPVINEGRIFVPFRAVAEALGAEVAWDAETKTVTADKDEAAVAFTNGESELVIGDEAVAVDAPVVISGDRAMVPLRALVNAYGVEVEWNNETKTADVYVKGAADVVESGSAVVSGAAVAVETTTADEESTEATTADEETTVEGTTQETTVDETETTTVEETTEVTTVAE